ncbi:hypothetical protein [Paenibacillus sp. NPDC057934]|uniref:hypothetical protein n=1 Tax=Paenibacillus sp. NPDC057934 TaxID=3346282 RepID=UPI0036DF3351
MRKVIPVLIIIMLFLFTVRTLPKRIGEYANPENPAVHSSAELEIFEAVKQLAINAISFQGISAESSKKSYEETITRLEKIFGRVLWS